MKIKIEDLLLLKNAYEDCFFNMNVFLEEFRSCIFDWEIYLDFDDEFKGRLKLIDKMHDYYCDCRNRAVNILCLDDIPFFLYQYAGKGYYTNKKILNKDKFNEFVMECCKTMIKKMEIKECSLKEVIQIDDYFSHSCIIEDGKLIAGKENKND